MEKSWLVRGESTYYPGDEKKAGSGKNSREDRFNVDEGRRDLCVICNKAVEAASTPFLEDTVN